MLGVGVPWHPALCMLFVYLISWPPVTFSAWPVMLEGVTGGTPS